MAELQEGQLDAARATAGLAPITGMTLPVCHVAPGMSRRGADMISCPLDTAV